MANYILTNKAVEELSDIWEYTFEVWSENQADNYYNLLIETCQKIAENHTIGKKYEEISKELLGFRVSKHIIFYRKLVFQEIEVIRILHGRMDLKTNFLYHPLLDSDAHRV